MNRLLWPWPEEVGPKIMLRELAVRDMVELRSHFDADVFGPGHQPGNILLRATGGSRQSGLRAEYVVDRLLNMAHVRMRMLDFVAHTRKLVISNGPVNKETCVAPHKRTGNVLNMGIADNLKRLRSAAELSQPQLAKMSGVSQQLISQIERGVNLSTKYLPALASALGCQVSEIDPTYQEQSVSTLLTKVGVMSWKDAENAFLKPLTIVTAQAEFLKEIILSGLEDHEYLGLQMPDDRLDRIAPPGSFVIIDLQVVAPVEDMFYVFRKNGEVTLACGRFRAGDPDRLRPFSTNADHDTQMLDGDFVQVGRIVRVITEV